MLSEPKFNSDLVPLNDEDPISELLSLLLPLLLFGSEMLSLSEIISDCASSESDSDVELAPVLDTGTTNESLATFSRALERFSFNDSIVSERTTAAVLALCEFSCETDSLLLKEIGTCSDKL